MTKRCAICGRFRPYEPDDRYCVGCGNESLEDACACGRSYDYALSETGPIHCPRCGRAFHGKSQEFDA